MNRPSPNHRFRTRSIVGLSLGSTLVVMASTAPTLAEIDTIDSSFLSTFPDAPVMNEAGQVAYKRRSSIGIIGQPLPVSIRRGDGNSISTVATTGNDVPTGPGQFESFSSSEGGFTDLGLKIAETGAVMFHALIDGTGVGSSNDSGIYIGGLGGVGQVAREGETFSSFGTTYEYVGFHAMAINEIGEQAFRAALDPAGIVGVRDGIIRRQGGPVLAAIQGDAAPGGGSYASMTLNSTVGGTKYQIDLNRNSQGAANQVAFYASLNGATTTTNTGLYRSAVPSSEFLHAREGMALNGSTLAFMSHPDLNDLNQVAYFGQLTNGNQGIYRSSDGGGGLATLIVAQEGQADPNGDLFTGFGVEPVLSNTGWTAFRATTDDGSHGLYRASTGPSMTTIVKRADAVDVPGADNNFLFDIEDYMSINERNHVAFVAEVNEGFVLYEGIYVAAGAGKQAIEVARIGHQIDGKTIDDLKVNLGRDTGGNIAFNDKAQVSFWASFAEGGSGIFRWTPTLKLTTRTTATTYNYDSTGNWNLFMLPEAIYDVAIADDPTKLPGGGATINGPATQSTMKNLHVGREAGYFGGIFAPTVNFNVIHPSDEGALIEPMIVVLGDMTLADNAHVLASDMVRAGSDVPLIDVAGTAIIDGTLELANARVRAGDFGNRGRIEGYGVLDGRLNNDNGAEVVMLDNQMMMLENTASPGDVGENHGLIQLGTLAHLAVAGRFLNDNDGAIAVGLNGLAEFDELETYGQVSGLQGAQLETAGDWIGHGVSIPDGGTVVIGGLLRPQDTVSNDFHTAEFDSDLAFGMDGGVEIQFIEKMNQVFHDRVEATGEVSFINALLSIDVWEHAFSDDLEAGDEFELISYGSRDGEFEEFDGLQSDTSDLIIVPRYTASAMSILATVLGDMNGNGFFDAFDVSDFEQALADPEGYLADVGLDPDIVGDMNGDGVFNAFDVSAFEETLASAGGSTSVPEPASLTLLGLGALATGRRRQARKLPLA